MKCPGTGKGHLCSTQEVGIDFPRGMFHSEGVFPRGLLQPFTTSLHSTGHVHQNPTRSLASSTIMLKSAHAQRKMYTGEAGISLFGCQQRAFFWKCFGKKMWYRAPDGELVVFLCSTFTLLQRLCKAGVKQTQNCCMQLPLISEWCLQVVCNAL